MSEILSEKSKEKLKILCGNANMDVTLYLTAIINQLFSELPKEKKALFKPSTKMELSSEVIKKLEILALVLHISPKEWIEKVLTMNCPDPIKEVDPKKQANQESNLKKEAAALEKEQEAFEKEKEDFERGVELEEDQEELEKEKENLKQQRIAFEKQKAEFELLKKQKA